MRKRIDWARVGIISDVSRVFARAGVRRAVETAGDGP